MLCTRCSLRFFYNFELFFHTYRERNKYQILKSIVNRESKKERNKGKEKEKMT